MRWIKTGKVVKATGESTQLYESVPGGFRIESRKRKIPHASRPGHWMNTTYFLIRGGEEKEYYSLRDAKIAAEEAACKSLF